MDDDHTVRSALLTALAQTLRPPLATLGVPLTHDLSRLTSLITLQGHSSGPLAPSHSDKASLGRTEIVHWPQGSAPAHQICLPSYSVRLTPQSEDALRARLNRTEARALFLRSEGKRQLSAFHKTLLRALNAPRHTPCALKTVPDQANVVWKREGDRSAKRLRLSGVAA